MYEADITIIGAGVVGLAIAAEVANKDREVFIIEKNRTFGQETSSRNSQIIHAGIYYPKGSLRAKTCVDGNALIYKLCEEYGIDYRRTGKLIVATDDEEAEQLEILYERGRNNGIEDLRIVDKLGVSKMEPNVRAIAALHSPSTGIFDAHALMRCLLNKAKDNGVKIIYKTKATGIEKQHGEGYKVNIEDRSGNSSFSTRMLINSAGLNSEQIAQMVGIDTTAAGYKLYYCKGEYFKLPKGKTKLVERLIYPVPKPKSPGLGIHVTPTLDGMILLGPSARYVDSIDYSIDESQKKAFYDSVVNFLPSIEYEDIEPEIAGIRPTLQAPGEDLTDFIIRHERDRGLPGFINLIGIESPGLTSSPAIARYVAAMVKDVLGN